MATIPLGALCKQTRNYIYPSIASKEIEYVCPECNRDLILVKGNQRIHHFRHKVNTINPCMHYDNPGESQIHKDAKRLLKTLIENNIQINIHRKCKCCADTETYEIPDFTVNTSKIILEYRFDYNDGLKIADVAYLDNDELVCIFEICHTHATCANDRPEPWFEIDATTLLLEANKQNANRIYIWCIRAEKCDKCVKYELEYITKFINEKIVINPSSKLKIIELNYEFSIWYQCTYERKCPSLKELHIYLNNNFVQIKNNAWPGIEICHKSSEDTEFNVNANFDANKTKNAIDKLVQWLKERKPIFVCWSCPKIGYNGTKCGNGGSGMEFFIKYGDNDKLIIDYVDSAVVCYSNDIKQYQFQFNFSKYSQFKNNFWIDPSNVIIDEDDETMILTCIRDCKDRYCDNCRILSEPWVLNLPRLYNRIGQENQWRQEQPCILCKRTAYSPVYVKGYRQICKICLCEEEVKKLYQNVKNKCIIDMSYI